MSDSGQAVFQRLRLRQFRNYREADVSFNPGLTILCGTNGQGKTNLLEAVHFLAFLRSFRTRQLRELIQFDAREFALTADIRGADRTRTLAVLYGDQRQLILDGVALDRASEFVNTFMCVPLLPEDIELIKGAASSRRRYLDMLIGQLDRTYLVGLHAFLQALKSRNIILRSISRYGRKSLDAYTAPLVRFGTQTILARTRCIEQLIPHMTDLAAEFFGEQHELRLEYRPGFPRESALARKEYRNEAELAAGFQELLQATRERDEREGMTVYGPQRDDLDVYLNGRPVNSFGSEGQCRLAALLLRLASVSLLRTGVAVPVRGPVLLVDDVFGELDAAKRRCFWAHAAGVPQILLTCTEIPPEVAALGASVVRVTDGVCAV